MLFSRLCLGTKFKFSDLNTVLIFFSLIRTTYPAHLILFRLINLVQITKLLIMPMNFFQTPVHVTQRSMTCVCFMTTSSPPNLQAGKPPIVCFP
jgi:hypothetical protein